MPPVTIQNTHPLGDIELPLIGRVGDNPLRAGEEFEVSEDIAGREPGIWREPTDEERAENYTGLVRRVVGVAPDLRVEVECPGYGLLAQTANYRRVTAMAGKQGKAPAIAPVTAEEN